MTDFEKRGEAIRVLAKAIVLQYLKNIPKCELGQEGKRSATIFRECGFDWGEYKNATSSSQQHWVVALMRELESEGKVKRVTKSGPWSLV